MDFSKSNRDKYSFKRNEFGRGVWNTLSEINGKHSIPHPLRPLHIRVTFYSNLRVFFFFLEKTSRQTQKKMALNGIEEDSDKAGY